MINLGANNKEEVKNERKKALGMLMRYFEISQYYRGAENLERAHFIFDKVNIRHVVIPKKTLASGRLPISFKTEEI